MLHESHSVSKIAISSKLAFNALSHNSEINYYSYVALRYKQ